jgi:uroporphyrinogen decarboxylase
MTTSRERVIRSLCQQPIDRAPRDLRVVPAVVQERPDDVAEMRYRFPPDIERPENPTPPGQRAAGRPGEIGSYTDAWGCHWRVDTPGATGQPVEPPLAEKAHIAGYQPPWELLDEQSMSRINAGCATSNRFMLAWAETRPMDRLRWLRGPEAAAADLAHGDAAMHRLLRAMHDFACREMELWAHSDVDGVGFGDDLGSAPDPRELVEMWRTVFKPLYQQYCNILHANDKFVFLHLDGDLSGILADLVEIGVDALHCDFGRLPVEQLAANLRGQITLWGELGDETMRGSLNQVRDAVTRVRSALDFGRGGLIAHCDWRPCTPRKNIAALFDQWAQPQAMRTRSSA